MAESDTAPAPANMGESSPSPAPAEQGNVTTEGQPSAAEILDGLGSLTPDQLAALETGTPESLTALFPDDKGEPEKKPEEKAGEQKTPTGEAATAAPEKTEDEGPTRVSLKAIPPAQRKAFVTALAELREGKHASIEDALAAHLQIKAPPAAAAPEKKEGEPAGDTASTAEAAPDNEVATLEAKVKDLTAKIEQAKAEFDYDGAEKLRDELSDAKADLQVAKVEAKRAATQDAAKAQEWTAKENASRDKVLDQYAELLTDPDSYFGDLLGIEADRAYAAKDPVFNNPEWPEKIASRVFEKHKKALTGTANSEPEPGEHNNPIPPAPKPGIRMPGAPTGNGANSIALTANAALEEFNKLSPEEQTAVLVKLDKQMA